MIIIQTFLFETDFYEQIRHKLSFIYEKIVRYPMHSIKNISERNKIDTDAYIKRKRLISTYEWL